MISLLTGSEYAANPQAIGIRRNPSPTEEALVNSKPTMIKVQKSL